MEIGPARSGKHAFRRLKAWRAIAARHDKTARNLLAGIALVVAVSRWTD